MPIEYINDRNVSVSYFVDLFSHAVLNNQLSHHTLVSLSCFIASKSFFFLNLNFGYLNNPTMWHGILGLKLNNLFLYNSLVNIASFKCD